MALLNISVFWGLLMNIASASVCLLMTGYLLWISIMELRGCEPESLPENYPNHWCCYIGGCRSQDLYIRRGWWVKMPVLQEWRGCWEKKGVFSKYSWPRLWAGPCCKQALSWSLGALDIQKYEESWWKCYVKQVIVWNPVPEIQCTCWQIEAIYGGSIY